MKGEPGAPVVAGDDDARLLDAARTGDARALDALLERHEARIYRFGMRMCGDPEDAKDVLQETMLAVARTVGGFRGDASFTSWLFAIARSFCLKKRRKRALTGASSLETDAAREAGALADRAPSPEEAASLREVAGAVDAAIAALEPGYREVLLLRDVEGLSASEVAHALGLSVQAVKTRLHRARLAVRARVAPAIGVEEPRAPAPSSSCPDVLSRYSERLEGEIGPELCAELEYHVESCDRCRALCGSLQQALALCHAIPAQQVPEEIQQTIRAALRAARS